MIASTGKRPSLRRQCALLSLHRSGLAYQPVPAGQDDLALMAEMDKIYRIRCTDPVSRGHRESGSLVMWKRRLDQRDGGCCSGRAGSGMVKGPNSLASSAGARRARVAAQ